MEKADNFQAPSEPPPPYQQAIPQPSHGYPHQPIYTQPGPTMAGPGVTVVRSVHTVSTGPVIVSQPGNSVMFLSNGLSHAPTVITCRSCNHQIVTRVDYSPTCRTHLTAALCCLLGLWPCAFLPYCMDSCRKADHYCPNCGVFIGTYL